MALKCHNVGVCVMLAHALIESHYKDHIAGKSLASSFLATNSQQPQSPQRNLRIQVTEYNRFFSFHILVVHRTLTTATRSFCCFIWLEKHVKSLKQWFCVFKIGKRNSKCYGALLKYGNLKCNGALLKCVYKAIFNSSTPFSVLCLFDILYLNGMTPIHT